MYDGKFDFGFIKCFLILILLLVSCIHSITDKPVPSRARATLPESHLTINKINDGIINKNSYGKNRLLTPAFFF